MTIKLESPADRLIVALGIDDIDVRSREDLKKIRSRILRQAEQLCDLGVIVKVNTALRACGYGLIDDLHDRGMRVFADLKLHDIPTTLANDGRALRAVCPDMVTVTSDCGPRSIRALVDALPNTEVVGVTILRCLSRGDREYMYPRAGYGAENNRASIAYRGGVQGLVVPTCDVRSLRSIYPSLVFTTPGIRPSWAEVPSDDQYHTETPTTAIKRGADRIIVGRPITRSNDLRVSARRVLDEIAGAL